tara:strand:- start:37721 stop:38347 length:627 start_codon:yes stop_codon:yes gene_type:complete
MNDMKHKTSLEEIETQTIHHYDLNAESFWQGTRDHDVSQNIQAFLSALPVKKSLDILDLGCGPGRDLSTFKKLGHKPVGIDGSKRFCEMAQKFSQCEVWHQHFLNLELGDNIFDGIFANASLFHIPSTQFPQVLSQCYRALKSSGVLFMSNPRGNAEGWQGNRYGHYMELEESSDYLNAAGFSILDHYYRPPGLPKDQQPWLAIVAQR